MTEIINESLKSIFSKESVLAPLRDGKQPKGAKNIKVKRTEIKKLQEELDIWKVMGLDEINDWI